MLRSRSAMVLGLAGVGGLLVLCLLASVRFGAASIGTGDVVRAFVDYGGSEEDLIIRTLRVPRAMIAALVGAALAVAGAIIQGLTRNPLSDPGVLGIEGGASLAVVVSVYFLGASLPTTYALFAFAGAAVAMGVVYGLGTEPSLWSSTISTTPPATRTTSWPSRTDWCTMRDRPTRSSPRTC